MRRSLTRRFTRRQLVTMRRQWRLGQAAKAGMLLLPLLVVLTYLLPNEIEFIRWGLFSWSVGEFILLTIHVALGVGCGVSFGWAFHHSRPLLLTGLGANRDMKYKAFLASAFGLVALFCLMLS